MSRVSLRPAVLLAMTLGCAALLPQPGERSVRAEVLLSELRPDLLSGDVAPPAHAPSGSATVTLVPTQGLTARAALGQSNRSAYELVTIPVASGATLRAVLFRPAGEGPHPAVVAMHGCGGLFTGEGRIGARHRDWGERLAAQGFFVLLPDSFGSRGFGSQCVISDRKVRPSRERVDDAIAGKQFLQRRTDVDPARVSLIGWSNGGSSVLWAAERKARPADGLPDFRNAVVFYPGCRPVLEAAERSSWEARLKILILMGEADAWTPIGPCRGLVGRSMTAGQPIEIVAYAGAVHDFDHPSRKLATRSGLAFTADEGGRAEVGTDPVARADALVRVPEFLRN